MKNIFWNESIVRLMYNLYHFRIPDKKFIDISNHPNWPFLSSYNIELQVVYYRRKKNQSNTTYTVINYTNLHYDIDPNKTDHLNDH